jgi:hypothetical protein
MRIVGRDYIFKIQGQEFYDSVFDKRKRYFTAGEPNELGKGSLVYFVMKSEKNAEYVIVGEGRVLAGGKLDPLGRDHGFASNHGWKFVTELEDLRKYPKEIPVEEVFSPSVITKIHSERPFGIDLDPKESKAIQEKISTLVG